MNCTVGQVVKVVDDELSARLEVRAVELIGICLLISVVIHILNILRYSSWPVAESGPDTRLGSTRAF